MTRSELMKMPLEDLCKYAQANYDDLPMEVMNERLKIVSTGWRIKPVIRWEAVQHTVKDGGNFEQEAGYGVYASPNLALAVSVGMLEAAAHDIQLRNAKIEQLPSITDLISIDMKLSAIAEGEAEKMYGPPPPPRQITHLQQ